MSRRSPLIDGTQLPGHTLLIASPEAHRQLALTMARLLVKSTRPDEAVRVKLRDIYANDAMAPIPIG
ncbi:hexameric tyrosine-coordinated heme protein [Rhodanobacter sp. AS-Z3]|uniref:hexameric tyrosine-coordinated heme protein n=1 Tax=Rhodanobacter sp. AS-Z3 TaxID=3031330 RepID=UPI0031F2D6C5